MSRKPTQETLVIRKHMEAYFTHLLKDGATFTLPDVVEYVENQDIPDVKNLRTTISNSMKQYEGKLFVDTGEKASTGKRGRKPIVWRKISEQNTEGKPFKTDISVANKPREVASVEESTAEKEPESSSTDFNF